MKGIITSKLGSIEISPEIIAIYAGTTAVECFGIVGMAKVSMEDGGWARLLKRESLTKGIQVTIDDDNQVNLDFHIIVAYGVSIQAVSDNLIADINCDNDELFFSQESNGTGSDYAPKRFYHYNFTSGEKECLASCSGNNTLNIGHSDCKYVFYNCYDIDKEEYTYYRYNMELGKEEKIDGLRENHYYSVFTDSDKAYYCSSDNSIQIYPLKNKETVVSDDFSRIYYSGNDVVAVRDNNIFIRGDNGDISKNGIKKP